MPLEIQEDGPVLRISYRQPLKSWFLINNLVAPPLYGFLCFLFRHARTPFWSAPFGIFFLLSIYFLLDRFFGRTVMVCTSGKLTITRKFPLWDSSATYDLMDMCEPYLTQEEWRLVGVPIQKIPWPYERPAEMRFRYRQKKTVKCCFRLTELELWELLSAIRKRNPRVDHKWSREPLPETVHSGQLGL